MKTKWSLEQAVVDSPLLQWLCVLAIVVFWPVRVIVKYAPCLIHGHRWFAPDLAHFHGQETNVFECRCDRCGYKTGMLGSEIQRMRQES